MSTGDVHLELRPDGAVLPNSSKDIEQDQERRVQMEMLPHIHPSIRMTQLSQDSTSHTQSIALIVANRGACISLFPTIQMKEIAPTDQLRPRPSNASARPFYKSLACTAIGCLLFLIESCDAKRRERRSIPIGWPGSDLSPVKVTAKTSNQVEALIYSSLLSFLCDEVHLSSSVYLCCQRY